jgi:hypothetical protein
MSDDIPAHPDLKWRHLVGLPYEYGTQDCFQLMRRFYADNWNIAIRPYAYPWGWWETAPHLDFFMRHFRDEGFLPVVADTDRQLQPGDGLLMALGTVVSHAGAYLGGGWFLHQPHGRESRVDRWAGGFQAATNVVVRHPAAKLSGVEREIDLIELLPAHKRMRYRDILARMAGEGRGDAG